MNFNGGDDVIVEARQPHLGETNGSCVKTVRWHIEGIEFYANDNGYLFTSSAFDIQKKDVKFLDAKTRECLEKVRHDKSPNGNEFIETFSKDRGSNDPY